MYHDNKVINTKLPFRWGDIIFGKITIIITVKMWIYANLPLIVKTSILLRSKPQPLHWQLKNLILLSQTVYFFLQFIIKTPTSFKIQLYICITLFYNLKNFYIIPIFFLYINQHKILKLPSGDTFFSFQIRD